MTLTSVLNLLISKAQEEEMNVIFTKVSDDFILASIKGDYAGYDLAIPLARLKMQPSGMGLEYVEYEINVAIKALKRKDRDGKDVYSRYHEALRMGANEQQLVEIAKEME